VIDNAQLAAIARDCRVQIIRMLTHAGSGHPGGSLSVIDLVTTLYFQRMRHDPKRPDWPDRDRLILSKGHAVPALYAAMARAGYFPVEELMTLRKFGSRLQGHPERLRLPGLETTSGPLGSGLSQAAGIAKAWQMDGVKGRRVYCVMSDGEQDEGNTWEAAMFAAKYRLANLTAITDRNNIQIDGPTEEVMPLENLREKWEAFGWYVTEIDGHNFTQIIDACNYARTIENQPVMIIAHTTPGKGVDFMENDFHWHGKPPNREEAQRALNQLRGERR